MAAQGQQLRKPNTIPLRLFDFSGGMYSKRPKEVIPANASPYCKNVLSDEKGRLTKVFGTSLLVTAANNGFADNPIYNTYNYVNVYGAEKLIVQAVKSSVMSIWFIDTDDAAATAITPAGVTLALNRRMNFATHKGLLYAWNGVNDLLCWQAQSTATWTKWHSSQSERFNFLETHNYRLWAANSIRNPIRVIYTGVNESHFGAYFGDTGVNPSTDEPYVGNENWMDFPTSDGTPVTGIKEFQDSLLVFKPYHIFRIFGDPSYGVTIKRVSDGIGCVAHDSIAVRNDATVFFMAHDGIYAYGDTQMLISAEDQKAYAGGSVIRLSSEIDDYWASYVTPPNPLAVRTLTKTADVDSGNWTLTGCSKRTAPISTHRPDVITFNLTSGSEEAILYSTSVTAYVSLQSVDTTNGLYDENIYYAQTITPGRVGATTAYGIPNEVDLYLENNGTLTSSQKINVYITDVETDDDGVKVPNMSVIYAEGQYALDPVTAAGWYTVSMTYWDYPQSIGAGLGLTDKLALVVKPVGDTTTLYAKWGYAGGFGGGRMVNSDKFTPGSQSTLDYLFRLNCKNFVVAATVETDAFDAFDDSGFVNWIAMHIEEDTKTAQGYAKRHKLVKIEYATKATSGGAWGSYTETENGGDISSSNKYVKFKLTYRLRSGASADDGDSFALIGIKASYGTQAISQKLVKGIIWDDRYLLACNVQDSGG